MIKKFFTTKSLFLQNRLVFQSSGPERNQVDQPSEGRPLSQVEQNLARELKTKAEMRDNIARAEDILKTAKLNDPKSAELRKQVDALNQELNNPKSTSREFLALRLGKQLNDIITPQVKQDKKIAEVKDGNTVFADDSLTIPRNKIAGLSESPKIAEVKDGNIVFADDSLTIPQEEIDQMKAAKSAGGAKDGKERVTLKPPLGKEKIAKPQLVSAEVVEVRKQAVVGIKPTEVMKETFPKLTSSGRIGPISPDEVLPDILVKLRNRIDNDSTIPAKIIDKKNNVVYIAQKKSGRIGYERKPTS